MIPSLGCEPAPSQGGLSGARWAKRCVFVLLTGNSPTTSEQQFQMHPRGGAAALCDALYFDVLHGVSMAASMLATILSKSMLL